MVWKETRRAAFLLNPRAESSAAFSRYIIGLPEDDANAGIRAFARYVVADWRGVEDREGNSLAYSPDTAEELLLELPELYVALREAAVQDLRQHAAYVHKIAQNLTECLLYELEQGPLEETLIRRAHAERRPIPEKIAKAPQLLPGVGFYLQSFLALSSCRALGMSEGRIPWHAAWDYSQRLGLTEQEFDDLWIVICHADAAYLQYRGDKAKADAKNRPSK